MTNTRPSSITVEEAVARMVNMDYIPEGFTLSEMTAAFQEEAEVEYENARRNHESAEQLVRKKIRLEACKARHSLTELLLESIKHELAYPDESLIFRANDTSTKSRLTLASITNWAADSYGVGIPEWSLPALATHDTEDAAQNTTATKQSARWDDVTIKIYADYRIGYCIGQGKYRNSSFQAIGLMGTRKNEPNLQGGILLGLSMGNKFPNARILKGKDKTAISKLRSALAKLTHISGDPFFRFNEADGWKPRFRPIDDRKNADERAKATAKHVPLDEARDFDRENDDADEWLNKNR